MKDIQGYEGIYAITEDGQVWSHKRKRFLRLYGSGNNYREIDLYLNGVATRHFVHRLVAQAYIPNPDNLPEVNHKNEDKSKNHWTNLEWCSRAYNNTYGTKRERTSQTILAKATGKPVYCVELDKVFSSSAVAARETGATSVNDCVNGRIQTSGGYHWRYA